MLEYYPYYLVRLNFFGSKIKFGLYHKLVYVCGLIDKNEL